MNMILFHTAAGRSKVHIAKLLPNMWSVKVPTKAEIGIPILSFFRLDISVDQTASRVEKTKAISIANMCKNG